MTLSSASPERSFRAAAKGCAWSRRIDERRADAERSIEQRARETAASTTILDLTWRHMLGLPNRNLRDDVEARRALAGVFRLTRPKVILAPYWEDSHPDHVSASQLADAARFWSKLSRTDIPGEPYHPPRIYYYWSIHLRIHPKPSFVIDIGDAIEPKLRRNPLLRKPEPRSAAERTAVNRRGCPRPEPGTGAGRSDGSSPSRSRRGKRSASRDSRRSASFDQSRLASAAA